MGTETLVLIEDDPGDALLFEALLEPEGLGLSLVVVRTLHEASAEIERLDPVVCVLDLGLPGCTDLEALEAMQSRHPGLPTVVLTGRDDRAAGLHAVAMGAQDYLVKGHETGSAIARSIRFAIERRRAMDAASALAAAESRQAEQARLESSLLARPHLDHDQVRWDSRYVAARAGLVGGDFMDCVQVAPDCVRLIVGDVAGHGPAEAALGVALRVGWRALVLNHDPTQDLLPHLDRLIRAERQGSHDFATAADVTVRLDDRCVVVRSAGHPPPHLHGTGLLFDSGAASPLGIGSERSPRPGTSFPLGAGMPLTLYTDGLFEVRRSSGRIGSLDDLPAVFDELVSVSSIDDLLLAASCTGPGSWRDDVAIGRLTVMA